MRTSELVPRAGGIKKVPQALG